MDNPLKPQPLMAEVLPGFTVLAILATAFVFAHLPQISPSSLSKFLNATTVIAGSLGALLSCWVIGTMLDAVRDLVEWVMDARRHLVSVLLPERQYDCRALAGGRSRFTKAVRHSRLYPFRNHRYFAHLCYEYVDPKAGDSHAHRVRQEHASYGCLYPYSSFTTASFG
jgi:hypothetical protein